MRILVTGATGLIGSRLTATLAASHEVWAVARRAISAPPHPAITWIQWDLSDRALPPGLPLAADVVVHLAQSEHYRDFPNQALDIFEVNVASTLRLLEWSRRAGAAQFILASSGGIGSAPGSFYLASKQSAELLTQQYADMFSVLILRFFFVYGSGQKPGMLVQRLIDSIRAGHDIPLAGADGPRLNPIHASDAVRAITAAIDRRASGRIDVAGPEELTLRRMCEYIGRRVSRAPNLISEAREPAPDLLGDVSEMSRRLERPECSFEAGIAEMLSSKDAAGDRSVTDNGAADADPAA